MSAMWLFVCFFEVHAAFLENALPLKLISITPSGDGESMALSGRDSLTVVFSRPVIALGSDFSTLNTSNQGGLNLPQNIVPFLLVNTSTREVLKIKGKTRWVTTFIARFDCDEDWPTDLAFSLVVNPNLRTFDGVPVKLPSPEAAFTTPRLTLCISQVISDAASNLTGGQWQPLCSGSSIPEVPPRGKIQLQFSHPVLLSLLSPALQIRSEDGQKKFTLTSCAPTTYYGVVPKRNAPFVDQASCVAVVPTELAPNMQYKLFIAAGTKYHSAAGPLSVDVEAPFQSLLPFKFDVDIQPWTRFSHNLYDLALRHGLAQGITADAVAQQMSLFEGTEKLDFFLTLPSVGKLRLSAQFKPQTTYKLVFRGEQDGQTSVKDGFDQVLQSQTISWQTAGSPSYLSSLDNYVVFEKSQLPPSKQWSLLARGDVNGNSRLSYSLASVPESDIARALSFLDYATKRYSSNGPQYSLDSNPQFRVVNLAMPSTPIFLRQSSSWSNAYSGAMTSVTDLSLISLADSDGFVFWVTRLSDGQKVEGATVQIFKSETSYDRYPPNRLLVSGKTDQRGLVKLETSESEAYNLRALVTFDGDATLLFGLNQYRPQTLDIIADVVTDRAVYKPGDTVYVKVYARSKTADFAWKLPAQDDTTLLVQWKDANPYSGGGNSLQDSLAIQWSKRWGTWSAELTVPQEASYGLKNLQIQRQNQMSIGSASITIADPRRPTATLALSSDTKFFRIFKDSKKVATFNFKATVLTGSGEAILGAAISVKWTLNSPSNVTSGTVTLTTTQDGSISTDFNLAAELRKSDQYPSIVPGSSLQLEGTWVGPTGELLSSDLGPIAIDYTDWSLSVSPSIPNPLPGWAFGVYVVLQDQEGNVVKDKKVSLSLFELDMDGNQRKPASATCNALSGKTTVQCLSSSLSLPALKAYQLVSSVVDSKGFLVEQTLSLGKSEKDWQSNPLAAFESIDFRLDQPEYKLGDTARLQFWNPFRKASLLVRYGNLAGKTQVLVDNVKQGLNSVSILVDPVNCKGGCTVAAVLAVARQPSAAGISLFVLPVDLPVSLLFDVSAPRTFASTGLELSVVPEKQDLVIDLKLAQSKVEPGQTAELSVSVFSANKASRVTTEIAIFVVDQAFLDVQPYPLHALPAAFQVSTQDSFTHQASLANLVSWKGYNATVAAFQRRTARDPWIYPNWQTRTWGGRAEVDMSDDNYLAQFSSELARFGNPTYCQMSNYMEPMMMGDNFFETLEDSPPVSMAMSARGAVVSMAMSAPAPVAQPSAPAKMSDTGFAAAPPPSIPSSTGVDIPIRSQFETTPLFLGSLVVSASEQGKVSIKLPGNIGKFSVRAYAVDEASHFGASESFIIVQKPLNLQAMLPRIARTGDKFECGVTVAGGDAAFDGMVTVTVQALDKGLQLGTSKEQTIRVLGTTPVQVRFDMSSVELGRSGLRFTASSPLGPSGELVQDGLEEILPVLALQDSVLVATSMAIPATADSTIPWTEGISFPPAVPGSGNLSISAGVGRYPAIVSLTGMLLQPSEEDLLDAELLVSRVLSDAVCGQYTPSSPSLVVSSMRSLVPRAVELLTRFTDSKLGLRWSDRYVVRADDWVDLSLNAYAIYADIRAGKPLPEGLTSGWRSALSRGIVDAVERGLKNGWTWSDYPTLARTFLALGPLWVPSASQQVKDLLSMSALLAQRKSMDMGGKATLALVHLIHGQVPDGDAIVDATVQEIISYTRVQGRTAYIATAPGQASAAWAPVQSDCLSVLSKKKATHPFVEKLANYVSQGNSVNTGCFFSFSARSSALAVLALADYDTSRDAGQPNVDFKVVGGSSAVLRAKFDSPSDPLITLDRRWGDLPATKTTDSKGVVTTGPAPLSFVAAGRGEVSVALSLSFVPAQLYNDPIYRGIYVEKVIRATDPVSGDAVGRPIQGARFGQIVQVTIQVTTPDDLWQVNLVDLVPGGLEPIDPNVGQKSTVSQPPIFSPYQSPVPFISSRFAPKRVGFSRFMWYDPFGSQQTRTDRVTWFANFLRAGTYSVSYKAVAVTPGVWQLPPAKASVSAQPEVMGLSSGGSLLVSASAVTAQSLASAGILPLEPFSPKECASACSNSEFCNLRSGKCAAVSVKMISPVNNIAATTPTKKPAARCTSVTGAKAKWLSSEAIEVSWVAPASSPCKVTGYRVQFQLAATTSPLEWTSPRGQPVTSTKVVIVGLDRAKNYRFRIVPLHL